MRGPPPAPRRPPARACASHAHSLMLSSFINRPPGVGAMAALHGALQPPGAAVPGGRHHRPHGRAGEGGSRGRCEGWRRRSIRGMGCVSCEVWRCTSVCWTRDTTAGCGLRHPGEATAGVGHTRSPWLCRPRSPARHRCCRRCCPGSRVRTRRLAECRTPQPAVDVPSCGYAWHTLRECWTSDQQKGVRRVGRVRTSPHASSLAPRLTPPRLVRFSSPAETFSAEEKDAMMDSLRQATRNTMFDQWLEAVQVRAAVLGVRGICSRFMRR
jgi:hypothetical protein